MTRFFLVIWILDFGFWILMDSESDLPCLVASSSSNGCRGNDRSFSCIASWLEVQRQGAENRIVELQQRYHKMGRIDRHLFAPYTPHPNLT
jgi:hypothetical protein